MPDCTRVDPLLTAYVDGALAPDEARAVSRHLADCSVCAEAAQAERDARDAIVQARLVLRTATVPAALIEQCRLQSQGAARAWSRPRWVRLAVAASLLVAVGGALYGVTAVSSTALAAELTADHVKCIAMNTAFGTHQSVRQVAADLADRFAWRTNAPAAAERLAGLTLVGERLCLYGEGRAAHVMFTDAQGAPVSLFMLPRTVRQPDARTIFGYHSRIWSLAGHTFVLVTHAPDAETEQLAATLRAAVD